MSAITMDSHLQVEYGPYQSYESPNPVVSTTFHELLSNISSTNRSLRPPNSSIDESGHVRNGNHTQWLLPPGLTSPPLGIAAPSQYSSDQFTMEQYRTVLNSPPLHFTHDMRPAASPTPISRQKWKIQLTEHEPFDFAFSLENPNPYTHIDGPPLTQVPGQIAPDDDSLTGAVKPSSHFNPSIDCVRPISCILCLFTSHGPHNSSL